MIIKNNIIKITIISRHLFSLIAPQHPKKAIKKTTQPTTITRMGIVSIAGINSEMLFRANNTATPKPMNAAPPSYKEITLNFKI